MTGTYALIVANPNSSEVNEPVSTHRTAAAAEAAMSRLPAADHRWAYVAARRPDGSYPSRVQAVG